MGFCPYFLQEYSSGGISASLLLIAGTLIDLLTLCLLPNKTKIKTLVSLNTTKTITIKGDNFDLFSYEWVKLGYILSVTGHWSLKCMFHT